MLKPIALVLAALVCCAALAACNRGPTQQGETVPAVTAVPQRTGSNEYVIGAGDSLSIFVYQAPELSDQGITVRPDGKISMPLVQDINAAGLTPPELANDITQRLRQYVKNPIVTVIVRSFVGPTDRQVRVIGEAVNPMAIPYRNGMTLLDVMIDAKGLTKYAAGNRAILVRREPNGKEEEIHVHLSDLINGGDLSANIRMQPGDTLIIPQTWF